MLDHPEGTRFTVRLSDELRQLRLQERAMLGRSAAELAAASDDRAAVGGLIIAALQDQDVRQNPGVAGSRSLTADSNTDDQRGDDDTGPAQPFPFVGANHQTVKLRRDGGHPLRFRGAPLFSARSGINMHEFARFPVAPGEASPGAGIVGWQSFALYLSETGQVAVAASLDLSGDDEARPVHRASWLQDGQDLQQFLQDHRPDHLFAASEPANSDVSRCRAEIGAALLTEFGRMTAVCRRPSDNASQE